MKSICLGPRLIGTDAASWRKFCEELLDCQMYAATYKRLDYLERSLVGNLTKRLPTYVHQRFDFLNNNFGETEDQRFDGLLQFVIEEENAKSTDFGSCLINEDHNL